MTQSVPERLDPLADRRESDEQFGKLVEQITQRLEARWSTGRVNAIAGTP